MARRSQEGADPRRAQAPSVQEAMEGGAAVRLARELSALSGSLRAAGGEILRIRTPGLHGYPTQVFVRWLLGGYACDYGHLFM